MEAQVKHLRLKSIWNPVGSFLSCDSRLLTLEFKTAFPITSWLEDKQIRNAKPEESVFWEIVPSPKQQTDADETSQLANANLLLFWIRN